MRNPDSTDTSNENSYEDSQNESGFIDLSFENEKLSENKKSLSDLNNRFARYIEYNQKQELNHKLDTTYEELLQIPTAQLENLKILYESEIKSLRDALDKQSNELAVLIVRNDILIAENDNNQCELKEKSLKLTQITNSLLKSEEENANLKIRINILQDNQALIDTLTGQLKVCQDQLKNEVILRTISDNACLTYKEKLEFDEAVFKKEVDALLSQKSTSDKWESLKNELGKSSLLQQMDISRMRLYDYLEEFQASVNDNFLDTITKAASSIGDQLSTTMKSKSTNNELMGNLARLKMELEKTKASYVTLRNRLSDSKASYENEISRLKSLISELSSDRRNDIIQLFEKFKELNDSIGGKVLFESELSAYRKMLESEEVRVGLHDQSCSPPTKRRKTTTINQETEDSRKILKVRTSKTCSIM